MTTSGSCPTSDAPEPEIDWHLSVNDFIAAFPQTFPVFMEYGVETCCGGSLSVADAAKAYGIPEPALRQALLNGIRGRR